MNKEKISDEVVRLLEFVEANGGPATVAKKSGIASPQVFYNYKKGLSKPGTDIYIKIKNAFPAFDANVILFGQPIYKDSESTETKLLQLELAYLRAIAKDKGIEIPKPKGATLRPLLVDQEGASEMLTESMFFGLLGRAVGRTQSRYFAKG